MLNNILERLPATVEALRLGWLSTCKLAAIVVCVTCAVC